MGEAETHGGKRKTREKKAVFITINIDRTLEAIAVICRISLGVWGKRKDFGGAFLVVFLPFFSFIYSYFQFSYIYPPMQSPAASLGRQKLKP